MEAPQCDHDVAPRYSQRDLASITCRAGVAKSLAPVLCPLQGSQSTAIVNRAESQGDVLLALQDAITVVDVSVVHPAAAIYRVL